MLRILNNLKSSVVRFFSKNCQFSLRILLYFFCLPQKNSKNFIAHSPHKLEGTINIGPGQR